MKGFFPLNQPFKNVLFVTNYTLTGSYKISRFPSTLLQVTPVIDGTLLSVIQYRNQEIDIRTCFYKPSSVFASSYTYLPACMYVLFCTALLPVQILLRDSCS